MAFRVLRRFLMGSVEFPEGLIWHGLWVLGPKSL